MTAPLIAPLIPPRARPGSRERGRPATPRRLPIAAAPEVPAVPDDVLYGFGRMDESGRVADRAMTCALGWQPGDRLTLTAAAGVVIARRDPAGMVTLPSKPYIVIPAELRRRCGLRAGDRVLLAVFPARDALAAYSFAVVDQALRAHAPVPGEGRRP
jgi:AbrB family looped-hinge helix DNA binding protein